jgi:tRNA threonylcarbamoyladenosine biosynthesis protein TsaE
MLRLRSSNVDDTRRIAGAIARLVRPRDLIVLSGEMGAGKTAFTQGFATALGVTDPVTSPTFNLVHAYRGSEHEVHHVDLYRLERTGELDDLGLSELLDAGGVMLVEWGEVAGGALGDFLAVRLDHEPGSTTDGRLITIDRQGPQWESRWPSLSSAVREWVES